MHRVISDYSRPGSANHSNIKVYVRSRPLDQDISSNTSANDFISIDPDNDKKIVIKDPDLNNNRQYNEVSFQFDQLFGKDSTQDEVFSSVCKPQIEHILNGFNCCCFAYGQTSSGKTYSMFGNDGEFRGIIPRSVEYIFEKLKEKSPDFEVAMVCSFLEIYNDQIRDLGKAYLAAMGVQSSNSTALNEKTSDIFEKFATKRGNSFFADVFHTTPRNSTSASISWDLMPGLKEVVEGYQAMNYDIREDADGNIFVKDLSMIPVSSLEEVTSIISLGLRIRATHETKMNASSSRSHTIFSIHVVQRDRKTQNSISGNLHLVDLAGSERLKKSESQGIRLKEALHINSSLSSLGKVIMALDPSTTNSHVPYRDSKLTRILQNSLGGNSYTAVLAAIHPQPFYYEECLSTLQFANRCRNVRNNPRVNHIFDNEDKERKIKRLLDEIAQLRNRINQLEFLLKEAKEGKISIDKLRKMFQKLGLDIIIDKNHQVTFNGQKYDMSNIINEASTFSGGGNGNSSKDGSSSNSNENYTDLKQEDGKGMNEGSEYMDGNGNIIRSNVKKSDKLDEKMLKLVNELKEANMELSKKNKEKKVLLEEQGRQINELQLEITKLKSINTHLKYETDAKLNEKEENYQLLLSGMKVSYDNDIQELLSHNDVFLSNHYKVMNNIPKTLSTYTKNMEVLKTKKYQLNENIEKEYNKNLQELEKQRLIELDKIQQQFSCYLQEKDIIISELIEKFNIYRVKKLKYIELCENEIIQLVEHTRKLENILDDVEIGKYRIKQIQSQNLGASGSANMFGGMSLTGQVIVSNSILQPRGNSRGTDIRPSTTTGQQMTDQMISHRSSSFMGAVVLPKGLRPQNRLRPDSSGLVLAKKIYEKHIAKSNQLENIRKNTLQKTLSKATKLGDYTELGPSIEDDPILQDQIGEFIKTQRLKSHESSISTSNNQKNSNNSSSSNNNSNVNSGNNTARSLNGNIVSSGRILSSSSSSSTQFDLNSNNSNNNNNNSHNNNNRTNNTTITSNSTTSVKNRPDTSFMNVSLPPMTPQIEFSPSAQSISYQSAFDEFGEEDNNESTLNQKLLKARKYIRQLEKEREDYLATKRLEEVAVEKLSQEMSDSKTLSYITQLEVEQTNLRNQLKDLSNQLRNSKVANASLRRNLDKTGIVEIKDTRK